MELGNFTKRRNNFIFLFVLLTAVLCSSSSYAGFLFKKPFSNSEKEIVSEPLYLKKIKKSKSISHVKKEPKLKKVIIDKKTEAALAGGDIISGFGKDLPLVIALQQIAPEGYLFSFAGDINPGFNVSWRGGYSWKKVLYNMLGQYDLGFRLQNETVIIDTLKNILDYKEPKYKEISMVFDEKTNELKLKEGEFISKDITKKTPKNKMIYRAVIEAEPLKSALPIINYKDLKNIEITQLPICQPQQPIEEIKPLVSESIAPLNLRRPALPIAVVAKKLDIKSNNLPKKISMGKINAKKVRLKRPPLPNAMAVQKLDIKPKKLAKKLPMNKTTNKTIRLKQPILPNATAVQKLDIKPKKLAKKLPINKITNKTIRLKRPPLPNAVVKAYLMSSIDGGPLNLQKHMPKVNKLSKKDKVFNKNYLDNRDFLTAQQIGKIINTKGAHAVYPEKISPKWIASSKQTLRAVLTDWSKKAGVKLYWSIDYDYKINRNIAYNGNYEHAVSKLLDIFKKTRPQPYGQIHKGSARSLVLVINSYDLSH